jgi:hypothetical protein
MASPADRKIVSCCPGKPRCGALGEGKGKNYSSTQPDLIYQGKIQGELIVTSKKVAAIAGKCRIHMGFYDFSCPKINRARFWNNRTTDRK